MKIYDGGSVKDELSRHETGNSVPSPITSLKSQLFIKFTFDGNKVGKGFTAKIEFGKYNS